MQSGDMVTVVSVLGPDNIRILRGTVSMRVTDSPNGASFMLTPEHGTSVLVYERTAVLLRHDVPAIELARVIGAMWDQATQAAQLPQVGDIIVAPEHLRGETVTAVLPASLGGVATVVTSKRHPLEPTAFIAVGPDYIRTQPARVLGQAEGVSPAHTGREW